MKSINYSLQRNAENKAIVHTLIIPLMIFLIIFKIEKDYSIISSCVYVFFISLMHEFRIRLEANYENTLRRQVFFNLLKLVFGLIVFFVAICFLLILGGN